MPRATKRRRRFSQRVAALFFQPDHGADGPAQIARVSRIVETQAAGVTVRRMEPAKHRETHPLDHYETASLLTERQINAAVRLTRLYRGGFQGASVTADLIGSRGGILSDEKAERQAWARKEYAEAMEQVPAGSERVLGQIVRAEWPTQINALPMLRIGLDCVADHWQLPRENI